MSKGLIRRKKVGSEDSKGKKYDTLSITMELERPLDIEKEIEKTNKMKKENEQKEKNRKKKRKIKIVSFIVIIAIAIISGFFIFKEGKIKYHASAEAKNALYKHGTVKAEEKSDYIEFTPRNGNVKGGVIFYPEVGVDPQAYNVLMRKISNSGYKVFTLKYDFSMPGFSKKNINSIIDKNKDIQYWTVMTHSNSGKYAIKYAAEQKDIKNTVLLAAYPDDDDLKLLGKNVCVIWGSNDGVLNIEGLLKAKKSMPANTEYQELEGANHSNFGDYGLEKGDNQGIMPLEKQIEKTADIVSKFLDSNENREQ